MTTETQETLPEFPETEPDVPQHSMGERLEAAILTLAWAVRVGPVENAADFDFGEIDEVFTLFLENEDSR